MGEEHEPFLDSNEQDVEPKVSPSPKNHSSYSTWKKWSPHILIHLFFITCYTALFVVLIHTQSKDRILRPASAIHNLDIEYTQNLFHNLTGNPYAGPPTVDLDNAWDQLLASMHIRVSKEELQQDNQASVALTDGGGYLGWLGVFHELHCVRMLRQWHHRDYYHAILTPDEEEHMESHIDHCFEMLRQSAVCHADTSLTTFKWHPAKSRPMFNASESVHTCVNWDVLMESISDRVVGEDEILRLNNPLMHSNG